MIGKLFNQRYQIIEKLGAGGTAIVYRGQDTLLNRAVTIKILREEYAGNNDFVRRFRHEAQAVASLSHPNIVAVYDVGFEENMHYIVMEFVEGESLKEYIKRKGVLKLSEACNIITQILAGVQHAHEHGIIHRDIKPHNILLGKDGRAKVTDFGIAVGMSDVTLTYNTSSRIMGSVHYISPEQVQGTAVTEKSDIYSAGVVFYEMLTGRLPFVGETPISIAMQHVQGELILPHQVNPDVPMGISYVVMRAMRKNPETRYASASEMAEAVRAAYQGSMDGVPVEAPTDEPVVVSQRKRQQKKEEHNYPDEEAKRSARRFTAGRVVLFALAAVLVVGIVWMAGRLFDALNREETVTVPYVVGMTQEQAETALIDRQLVPVVVEKNSTTVASGLVITQSVAAEQEVSPGREIEITVNLGEPLIDVPSLVGSSQRIAEMTLTNLGLLYVVNTEYNEEIPEGQVIMQSPDENAQVAAGSTVTLLVSLGKEPVKFSMQPLVGKTLEEAQAYIEENGLVLTIVTPTASYEYEENVVVTQSLAPGTEVETGDEIELTVSEGPGPTAKTYIMEYDLPQDYEEDEDGDERPVEIEHSVVITVEDVKGLREVFNQVLAGGSLVTHAVEYYNEAVITLLVDGVVVDSVEVD